MTTIATKSRKVEQELRCHEVSALFINGKSTNSDSTVISQD